MSRLALVSYVVGIREICGKSRADEQSVPVEWRKIQQHMGDGLDLFFWGDGLDEEQAVSDFAATDLLCFPFSSFHPPYPGAITSGSAYSSSRVAYPWIYRGIDNERAFTSWCNL